MPRLIVAHSCAGTVLLTNFLNKGPFLLTRCYLLAFWCHFWCFLVLFGAMECTTKDLAESDENLPIVVMKKGNDLRMKDGTTLILTKLIHKI